MRKAKIACTMAIALTTGFMSCTDNDCLDGVDATGKHLITLSSSISENNIISRALGDGKGDTLKFSKATQVSILFNSEKLNATDTKNDDPSIALVTTTPASDKAGENKTKVELKIDGVENSKQYFWDDFYGRDAQLSIYAVGVEGKKVSEITNNKLAIDKTNKGLTWSLSTTQTSDTYAVEDLLLSNNIQKVNSTDNRLKYSTTTSFPTGHLYFRHALSKIIVNVKKGTGVDSTDLVNPTLKVNNFYTEGFLNVTTGAFDVSSKTVKDITPIVLATPATSYDYSYECLVIPSRDMDTDNQIFTLTNTTTNNNVYNINTKMFNKNSNLAANDQLKGKIEPGKQYIFNITVNKSGIELTASIMNWDTQTPDGLKPVIVEGTGIGTAGLGTNNNPITFDLYRSTVQATGYDANTSTDAVNYATIVKYDSENGFTMNPQLYWPNHTTAYFYRGLCELDEDGKVNTTTHVPVVTDNSKDYVAISTCKEQKTSVVEGDVTKEVTSYVKDGTDICMGAPYTKTTTTGTNPTTTITLTEAKKASDGNLNMTFYHGLAEIYVQLLTNTAADAKDAITLDNAVVEIENSITDGKYYLNDAKITAGTTRTPIYSMGSVYKSDTEMTLPDGTKTKDNVYRCYAVPQTLAYTSGSPATENHVTIKITTTEVIDGVKKKNIYNVDARNIVSTNTFTTAWNGGNRYLYKVTLLKSGVSVTATLLDWTVNKITNDNVVL